MAFIGALGEHPDLIKTTLEGSLTTQKSSIRPLKSQLAKLDARHTELSNGIQQFLDLVKRNPSSRVADSMLAEVDQLAAEQTEVDREREKLRQQILHREKVICDEQVIADCLRRFKQTFETLPFDDQAEILRLLIKDISVKHFDPEKDAVPANSGSFATQIRTKAYLINIKLFASDLQSTLEKSAKQSSHLNSNGCLAWIRTMSNRSRIHTGALHWRSQLCILLQLNGLSNDVLFTALHDPSQFYSQNSVWCIKVVYNWLPIGGLQNAYPSDSPRIRGRYAWAFGESTGLLLVAYCLRKSLPATPVMTAGDRRSQTQASLLRTS